MVPWVGISLPVQGTRVQSWSEKISHAMEQLSPCTTTTEPTCPRAHAHSKKSHCSEKHARHNWRVAPAVCNQRKLTHSNKDSSQPKIIKQINKSSKPGEVIRSWDRFKPQVWVAGASPQLGGDLNVKVLNKETYFRMESRLRTGTTCQGTMYFLTLSPGT